MIAALFLASSLALTGAPVKPEPAPTAGQRADQARFETCVALIEEDAEDAYEQAMAWRNETHAPEAARCAALAMIGRGEPAVGAAQLEQLARAKNGAGAVARADMLMEAGNAWMLASAPGRAAAAFSAALKLAPKSPEALIDRAQAYALDLRWRAAEDDLTAALDIQPKHAYALALRAKARFEQEAFDLALRDAQRALALEPGNEVALLVRGQTIDAQNKAQNKARNNTNRAN